MTSPTYHGHGHNKGTMVGSVRPCRRNKAGRDTECRKSENQQKQPKVDVFIIAAHQQF